MANMLRQTTSFQYNEIALISGNKHSVVLNLKRNRAYIIWLAKNIDRKNK